MYKLQIVNMLDEISSFLDVVQFHASGLCHLAKVKFLLDTREATIAKIGRNTCRTASAEWVKHPVSFIG